MSENLTRRLQEWLTTFSTVERHDRICLTGSVGQGSFAVSRQRR